MSGGSFDYNQYHIEEIADEIEWALDRQGKEKDREDLWMQQEYYEKYPEEKLYETYPKDVQDRMKEAVRVLRMAHVYAQRVDWYLSGDDGDDNFIKRLATELNSLNKETEV